MQLSVTLFVATLMLAASAPAFASPPDVSTPPATESGASAPVNGTSAPVVTPVRKTYDPDEVICKHPQMTGSLLGGPKDCRTRRQWDEMTENARNYVNGVQGHIQNSSSGY